MIRPLSLVAALCFVASTSALAQDNLAPPPPPPGGSAAAPSDAPAVSDTAAPSADTGGYGMRVRFGASVGPGAWLNPGAFAYAAEARVGLQINQMLGAYLAVSELGAVGLGGSVSQSGATVSASAIASLRFAIVGEATFFDRLFLAVGPELNRLSMAGVTESAGTGGASVSATTADGIFPGLNARLGIGFGHPNDSGRRTGFNMMLDASAVITPGGVSLVPMLMFGFESK